MACPTSFDIPRALSEPSVEMPAVPLFQPTVRIVQQSNSNQSTSTSVVHDRLAVPVQDVATVSATVGTTTVPTVTATVVGSANASGSDRSKSNAVSGIPIAPVVTGISDAPLANMPIIALARPVTTSTVVSQTQQFAFRHVPESPQAEKHLRLRTDQQAKRNFLSKSSRDELLNSHQGFSLGLIETLQQNISAFPLRVWIVDNSSSMLQNDGQRMALFTKQEKVKCESIQCTRWSEMQDTVTFHAKLAGHFNAQTVFRFLNQPQGGANSQQEFGIAQQRSQNENGKDSNKGDFSTVQQQVKIAVDIMDRTRPTGKTPLTEHVRVLQNELKPLRSQLYSTNTRVVVVLATDGLPTDASGETNAAVRQAFVEALKELELSIPVWVVIRLSTNEKEVVDFYNTIDKQLERNVEVLDDWVAGAKEIAVYNPWLNYSQALHRVREWGYHHRLIDLLDERALTLGELYDFCQILLGTSAFQGLPHPELDFQGFIQELGDRISSRSFNGNATSPAPNAKDPAQLQTVCYNSYTKRMERMINIKKLNSLYGPPPTRCLGC